MKRMLWVMLFVLMAPVAWAQGCAMCTKTASELDNKSAKGLNSGILYLATLPLAILGTIGFVWWKHNKTNV